MLVSSVTAAASCQVDIFCIRQGKAALISDVMFFPHDIIEYECKLAAKRKATFSICFRHLLMELYCSLVESPEPFNVSKHQAAEYTVCLACVQYS